MSGPGYVKEYKLDEALARIAELEDNYRIVQATNRQLEAERDRLKAENDALVNNWASALAGDLVKAGESEFSALSDPSGE